MSCCSGCESGLGNCGSGLGAIPQQLSEMAGGNPFQFGFNVGYFNNELYRPEDIASVLENQGLSYNTHSYAVAGLINPYLAVEGYAVTSWPSASQFAEAIYQAISGAGYPVDYGSIQFRFETYAGSTVPAPPPMGGTPYPNTQPPPGGNQLPPAPPGQCVWSQMTFGDYVACQLGIKGAVQGAAAGATGALVGVFAIGLAAILLLKR